MVSTGCESRHAGTFFSMVNCPLLLQMSSEGFWCKECRLVFPGPRQYNDHQRSEHQAQQVVCPWCPKWAVFALPGSLRRHVGTQHKGLEGEELLAVNVAYYFATKPELYRNTTTVKPLQHAVSKRAVATLQLWAKTVNSTEYLALLEKAEEDWKYLGSPEPKIKAEKRTSEIRPVFTPKKRCVDPIIPQPEDLELIQVCLTNTTSRAFISWFLRGTFQVEVRQGDRQSRTLLRRMQALHQKGPFNTPSGAGESVRDPSVMKVLADLLGLPLEDLASVQHLGECQEMFNQPNQAINTVEEFGAPGVLPAGLVQPASDSSGLASPLALSLQEVPGTEALPSGDLTSSILAEMKCLPASTPVTSSLVDVPQAPLAPVSRPFRDSSAAQPVVRPVRAEALDLLKTGSWPSLCPGRRDWTQGTVSIPLPIQKITWPPRNWLSMTQQQRQGAWQAVATMLSLADEAEGNFPDCDPAVLMDNYSFLALPGSGPSPTATTPADRAMTELRASNHRAVKYALDDTRDQRHLQSLTRGLSAGVNQGPMGPRQVLSLIDAAAIPLRPLRREAQKTTTKAAAPVKTAYRPTPIPAYSPTKPWIVQ